MPTVSVIIPNYNHARFLRQRIESVLGQTYQDFEVILLDDGSSQGSPTPPYFLQVLILKTRKTFPQALSRGE